MRKVICNTTPIISLLKIDKLHILEKLYGRIIVPKAVYDEIEKGRNKKYYLDIKSLPWIEISKIRNTDSRLYFLDLDNGEAEVLILANEMGADLVIIDEIMGRRYAKQFDLNLTGTIGVLLKAKEKKIIDSVMDLIFRLTNKGTWISPKLIEKIKILSNES